jgi:hypothetical protein
VDESAAGTLLTLRYGSAEHARRDRLPEVARGVIARLKIVVREGDVVPVRIELDREKVSIDARARIRWMTPLARGSLAGLELEGPSRREEVQLDLLLGIRSASRGAEAAANAALLPGIAAPALPLLSVAMLQPNRVLREVISSALVRLARDGNGWDLQLDAVASVDAFLAAMAERRRNLALVDCDGIGAATDALVDAVRSHADYARLPLVLLSRTRTGRLEDRYTLTIQKPVGMKSLLDTTGMLLRG